MEEYLLNNTAILECLNNLPPNYIQYVIELNNFTLNQQFEEAINCCNQLMETLNSELMKCDTQIIEKLDIFLKYCIKRNNQNYQAWCNTIFQKISQQKSNHNELINFFIHQFIQIKNYTDGAYFYQAICICSALTQWLKKNILVASSEYQTLLEFLLSQLSWLHEKTCFNWLRLDYSNFMRYHYLDKHIRQKINDKLRSIKKNLSKKDYHKTINLYTNFITDINQLSTKTHEPSHALTSAWQKFLIIRRQQVLFNWLISNKDCLEFDKYVNDIEMLKEDLILITDVKYFTEQIKLEAQCRWEFINLLFRSSIEQDELCELRRKFCVAFDLFNQRQEKENTALVLLGLAILNAYEGNKQEMLIGLRLAVQYDKKLKNLTQPIIDRLPFYMELKTNISKALVNPLFQSNLTEIIEPPALKRK